MRFWPFFAVFGPAWKKSRKIYLIYGQWTDIVLVLECVGVMSTSCDTEGVISVTSILLYDGVGN